MSKLHPLQAWRKQHRLPGRIVAPALGISTAYLSLIEASKAVPSLAVACRIVSLTGNAVLFTDLLPPKDWHHPGMDELLAQREDWASVVKRRSETAKKGHRARKRMALARASSTNQETT